MEGKIRNQYTVQSKTDLLDYLKGQDITVPAQTKGRTSKHCERWGVFRLLATWANNDQLSYPLTFVHQDRPDFLLDYDKQKTGVEFSELVSEEYKETRALAKKMGESPSLLMGLFKRGTPKRSLVKKKEIILNPSAAIGSDWSDADFAQECAMCIMDSVNKKTKDFRKSGFQKYDVNWLLLCDNLGVPSSTDIKEPIEALLKLLKNYWPQENGFDGLLIDTHNRLLTVCHSGWSIQKISDLWPSPI